MIPDLGGVGLIFYILPFFLAFPLFLAAITVAAVASSWGRSGMWGFVGLLSSAGAGSILGWLGVIIITNTNIEGGAALVMFFLWIPFTWVVGSAGVLVPLWQPARKRIRR